VFCESVVHNVCVGVHVGEEDAASGFGSYGDSRVPKVGGSAELWDGAVYDHGGDAGAEFVWIAGAIAVTMGFVLVGFCDVAV